MLVLWVLVIIFLLASSAHPRIRDIVRQKYGSHTEIGPPQYLALRRWEATLPQHNLSLPFPEGKNGRYVKFSNQAGQLGWNNCFNEVLMNAHLAYVSGRAYVFQEYRWASQHYQWPREKWITDPPRTPLNAIVSGPVAGGPFEADDPAPRAVSENWFDIVCPREERRVINTREVKPFVADAPGIEVLARWQTVLRDAPERCIEIEPAGEDPFSQTFDLGLWGSTRILSLWDSFVQSPITRLLDASPIVRAAVDSNTHLFVRRRPRPVYPAPKDPFQHMLAVHLRRGDYESHCRMLASMNAIFYSWNLFPHLPDRFVPELDAPGKDERFLARCWPDVEGVVKKAAEARRDYLAHHLTPKDVVLDVIYILTNEKSRWIDELKSALQLDGWKIVATSQKLVLNAEQTDVSMAVDMEIARRAAVFLGNGRSSFTSNIVYTRLVDNRDPITIRYT